MSLSVWFNLVLVIQIISAVAIVVLVLMQQGKGADMGSGFGGGQGSASGLFGAAGSANFLSRSTKWAAVVFSSPPPRSPGSAPRAPWSIAPRVA